MSIGTALLGGMLLLALVVAAIELWLAPRFRAPSFAFGLEIRTAPVARLHANPDGGSATSGLLLSPDRSRFLVRRRLPLGIPNPIFAAGSIVGGRESGIVQVRLALGGPTLLALSAVLCGHLSGKINPFLQGPVTPQLVAMAVPALVLVFVTWWAVRDLLRQVDVCLAALPGALAAPVQPAAYNEDR